MLRRKKKQQPKNTNFANRTQKVKKMFQFIRNLPYTSPIGKT